METIIDYNYGIPYTPINVIVMVNALSRKSYCNNHVAYKARPQQDDLTYREHPDHVLVQAKRLTRLRAIKFLKNRWSNHFEDEATW